MISALHPPVELNLVFGRQSARALNTRMVELCHKPLNELAFSKIKTLWLELAA